MSMAYGLGFLCGILVVALAAAAVGAFVKKRQGKGPKGYDERQVAAQGRAAKAAYFTLLGYLLLYGFFDVLTEIVWCDRFTGVFVGALISVAVYAVICIMEDAYFRVVDSTRTYIVLFAVVGVFNVALGVAHMVEGDFAENGVLQCQNSMNFFCGLMILTVLGAILVKLYRDKRQGETE